MSNLIRKYEFNRISFCYECFNHKELKKSTQFLFYRNSDNKIHRSELEKLNLALSRGFTPHIFFCMDYSEDAYILKYVCACGICNMEFINTKENGVSLKKKLERFVSIDYWNDLIDSSQTF